MRKWMTVVLALCMVLSLVLPARAAVSADVKPFAEQLILYYRHHGDEAADVIWDILRQMEAVDPNQAAVWRNLMADWAWVNNGMPVGQDVLPDGLPEDESLCILVLGFGLNEDGSMKEELIDRLVVALTAALKYPKAWIAVSGGQTSPVQGVTEAGQMAAWLEKKGVEKSRILKDTQSLSTTANAVNVYKLLNSSYPQVRSLAVISSDYHLSWGSAMFAAVSNYRFGYQAGNPIDVVAGAACTTGQTFDSMLSQAWGVGQITGVSFDEHAPAPALYYVDRPVEVPQETTEEAAEAVWPPIGDGEELPQLSQEAEPEGSWNWTGPILLTAAAASLGIYLLTPKKPKKKRKRPQWNWDV